MDFFQSQDHARKQTVWLVVLFSLAIISLVVLTNLLAMFVLGFLDVQTAQAGAPALVFNWQIFFTISALVISVVLLSSLYKISSLRHGGDVVAEMLGGERISADNNDLDKQKILNVVEEMAIASGTPVPPVYLINEEGINAFAAGYSPADAVIGVTRGCIEQLSRSELQGVIGHEFSHILNGDMRLNIRLIGILHGILVIGLIGYFLLRPAAYGRIGGRSRNNNAGGIMALAIGLVVIGYAGTFFGNLIKAAVSRQREYLADASAVQFTRNNMGIANALKRIGSSAAGSRIENPAGAQISHALFAEGVSHFFSSMFATHPPLEKRIRQLDPQWDGSFSIDIKTEETDASFETTESGASRQSEKIMAGLAAAGVMLNQVGQPDAQSLLRAQALLQHIPIHLRQEIYQPYGARAIIYLLLLNQDEASRQAQLQYLQSESDDGVFEVLEQLVAEAETVEPEHRLPLLDMSLPALRQLSRPQYERFKNNIQQLVEMDKKISLHEWSLQKILLQNLDRVFIKASPVRGKFNAFNPLRKECSLLLSVLIYINKDKHFDKDAIMTKASKELGGIEVDLLPVTDISLPALNTALDKLNQLKPLKKPALLKACVICITADNDFSPIEAELFRAIASTLDCPMPPISL